MSDLTQSDLDKGTINSDQLSPNAGREQAIEGQQQDREDAQRLRTDDGGGQDGSEGAAGAASPGRHVGP